MKVPGVQKDGSRLRPFHVKHLDVLPPSCAGCPLGPAPARRADGTPASWLRAAEQEWGQAGIGAWHGSELVGYLLLSPPLHVPREGPQSRVALSPDAAVVMTLRVLDEFSRFGLGRQLVQGAAAMVARGRAYYRALEVEATRAQPSCALPPAEFLESVGFIESRPDAVRPRLRLDLARTVRWRRPHLSTAVGRLAAWGTPPVSPPEPAAREGFAQVGEPMFHVERLIPSPPDH